MKLPSILQSKAERRGATWAVAVLLLIFVVYRLKFAPTTVDGCLVVSGPVVAEVMGTGTLEARIKTVISPKIQERLAEVLVDQNDTVKAGQLLARLDDGELGRQVEITAAALAGAKATVERVRADEARAEAVLQQARLDHQRASDFVNSKVGSQADFERAGEQLGIAEAERNRTRAASVEAELQVVTAEKTLLFQQERLGYTRILSPYDGLIVRRDRDPGGVVVPGGSLLQLISTDEIWVSAWVDETALRGLAAVQPTRVVFRSEPDRSYPGEVARLGREADRETREFLVDVRVRERPVNWTIGQRAEVFIEAGRKASALTVPPRFLQWREGRPGVFVNDRGRARWRVVELGLRGRAAVEIVTGLVAGEQVVIAGDATVPLVPGCRIAVR